MIKKIFLGGCLLSVLSIQAGNLNAIKFAFVERDITPPVGISLGGYGKRPPSCGIIDPLFMRVLAMKDSKGDMCVILTVDIMYVSDGFTKKIRSYYAKKFTQKPSSIMFNASHSHCAPYMRNEYFSKLVAATKSAIDEAIGNLKSGTVKFVLDQADIGVCRRLPWRGHMNFRPYVQGYYDPDLPIFAFYDLKGKLQGILWNYAAHNSGYGSRIGGDKNKVMISAEWSGAVNSNLKKLLGKNVATLFLQGAAGDIKPRFIAKEKDSQGRPMWGKPLPPEMDRFGAKYAQQIAAAVRSDKMKTIPVKFDSNLMDLQHTYDLNHPKLRRKIKTKEYYEARAQDQSLSEKERSKARKMLKIQWYKGGRPKSPWELQRITINDKLQILGHSGEPTSQLGRLVKDEFPDKTTIFAGYIRGGSYMTTWKQQQEGGYEAKGYGKDAEDNILKAFKNI